MNLLDDVITYVRRIIKSPSNATISNNLIIDYINRFWIVDVDARLQLFDLKTQYQFQTIPGVDRYNMPLYDVQIEPGNQNIGMYPLYQGFLGPVYINGVQVPLQTQKNQFFNIWPNVVQNLGVVAQGDGTSGPYTLQIPILPGNQPQNPPLNGILRGHIDISGIIATGNNVDPPLTDNPSAAASIASVPVTSVDSAFFLTSIDSTGANVVVQDSGWFLLGNVNYGLLMNPGKAPFGNQILTGGYSTTSNTINYFTGAVTVTFPVPIPQGQNISAQCFFFQTGLPRGVLYYNNTITLRSPPDTQYLVQLDAYLSPAAFLNTEAAIPFGYMAEYIARGAARKILSDTGDVEQFQFYEPLFREQELLVWKRSQRQWTANRTETIYSQGFGQGAGFNNNYGGGVSL
jgi:hypothetical protein